MLTHKIAAIGGVGLLGVALVGGIYFVETHIQTKYLLASDHSSTMATLNDGLATKMLEARRAEKDFLLRNDVKYADRVRELGEQVESDFEKLGKQSEDAGLSDLSTQIETARAGFKTYVRHFMTIADAKRRLGLDENSGLEGALRGSVQPSKPSSARSTSPRSSSKC